MTESTLRAIVGYVWPIVCVGIGFGLKDWGRGFSIRDMSLGLLVGAVLVTAYVLLLRPILRRNRRPSA